MYELVRVSEHDYYIDCPAKIGIVDIGGGECIAIDSGNDADAGKKVLKAITGQGWKLKAVFNTHSHADHIGGNRVLQDRTGCGIYAPGIERDFTNHPILEPAALYGGFPFKDLKHKFLTAKESRAELLTEDVLPAGMRIIPLPGHSFDMVGFMTADDNAYIADSVSSEATLSKYGIGYVWDVAAHLRTLDALKKIDAKVFIPAHAEATENIALLAEINICSARDAAERIHGICGQGMTTDDIITKVFETYDLVMNAAQYALIGSTVRSYLAYLKEEGQVELTFEDRRALWRAL